MVMRSGGTRFWWGTIPVGRSGVALTLTLTFALTFAFPVAAFWAITVIRAFAYSTLFPAMTRGGLLLSTVGDWELSLTVRYNGSRASRGRGVGRPGREGRRGRFFILLGVRRLRCHIMSRAVSGVGGRS